MFVTRWEYEVKPGCEERFEKVYGPEGDWAKLFWSDPSYRETRLLRNVTRAAIYLTFDFWSSREAYEQFMEVHGEEYRTLDAAGEKFTLRERKIGGFESVGT